MDNRTQAFPRLKPLCVALHQAALQLNGPSGDVQKVAHCLEDLKHTLSSITSRPNSLDEKIAEYVFIPLSYVLKASHKVSLRCLELTFQCLAILIDQGWRSRIQPQLAAQVIILCSLMAEKHPKGIASSESTTELQSSALWCLYHVFEVCDSASDARSTLTSETNFPQLGQTISTILDAMVDGGSAETQIAAMNALRSLVKNVATREIQAAFLPGIVSKLTRVLTPQTKQRRNHTVLVGSLDILRLLLLSTLSDDVLSNIKSPQAKLSKDDAKAEDSSIVDENWLEKAAIQLKPAITNVIRLKDHTRVDVKESLAQLCLIILKQCRETLANCTEAALEALLLMSAEELGEIIQFRLESLIAADAMVSNLLQKTLYDWLQSLTTKMQGADEQAKVQRLHQISTAYGMLANSGADTSTLDRLLGTVLRDSVVTTLQLPSSKQRQAAAAEPPVQSLDLAILGERQHSMDFTVPLTKHKGQQDVMDAIRRLSKNVNSVKLAGDLARTLRQSHGEVQIASFWLLLDSMQTAIESKGSANAVMNFEDDSSALYSQYLEEMYALALEVLNDSSEESPDQRLQALALRALALRARKAGKDFRMELIDSLYPVLHALASPDDLLQQDSITTLNIFTASCGYGSVKDLIVDNVDYLTNAVALKLNAFDVSPQAPQVLLMMVRLAGPSLLPYLEDTVDSIFAALEDYHGYPILVELLFRVLSVVAEEGTKAPQLAITDGKRRGTSQPNGETWRPTAISELADLLKERAAAPPLPVAENEPHPQRPWKSIDDADDEESEENEIEQEGNQVAEDPEPPPPAPKTYSLLLKISELTQHFLPSASSSLRSSLLALLKTTTPAIAQHENSFLPLINTLWPEIVSRLDDSETHVVGNALDMITTLCQYAGDFMRSRVAQLWPTLVDLHQQTVKDIVNITKSTSRESTRERSSMAVVPNTAYLKQAIDRMRSGPTDYSDTGTRFVWSSLVHAITAAVQYVALTPELFDEALEMLEPLLEEPDVRTAFEVENSDAVWLAQMRNGTITVPKPPTIDGYVQWSFAAVHG